ncbi:MAG: APC family permease [Candidatus Marinarcus sp.]|uniref:APC family permease n=1 Tax=Candidatus Marinarcus sp. TaxID=3100987 RepID=UPI003B0029C2
MSKDIHRRRNKALGALELVAIALGGMIGGGIFTVFGVSVSLIGVYTPIAFVIGGLIAALASYSYIKLGVHYQDEGAPYSFIINTFTGSSFLSSVVGWWIVFGYISTLALYAYTFASYAISTFEFANNDLVRKGVAGCIILIFTLVNVWSVKGMGKIEDLMVYSKLIILTVISVILISHSNTTLPQLVEISPKFNLLSILIVASLTFVAFEGFQLVINAVDEMEKPKVNIPKSIYIAISVAIVIYVIIASGGILAIPFDEIIQNKEYALAAGAKKILGEWGSNLIIIGALLATSSAISGTLFGASRLVGVIAKDGYFPLILNQRKNNIPMIAIFMMALFAFVLILIGNLEMILEFGSITFLLVSILVAFANLKMYKKTGASLMVIILSIVSLTLAAVFILYYEFTQHIDQLYFIVGLYVVLTLSAWLFSRKYKTQ